MVRALHNRDGVGATVSRPNPSSERSRPKAKKDRQLMVLALPALITFIAFSLIPLVGVLVLSFTNWNGLARMDWIGVENWAAALKSPETGNTLVATLKVVGFTVAFQTPVSLLLGVFIAGKQKYRVVLATIFFVPLLMSSSAIALTFVALLDPYFGLGSVATILRQNWLGNPTMAMMVVVFVFGWQNIPFHTLIYQAGVRQIPESLYEAAVVDGVSRVQCFFFITLPQLKYTMITSLTLMIVGSLTFFDMIFVLTGGGPGNATAVLPVKMYSTGFSGGELGAAAVYGVMLATLGLCIALSLQRLGGKDRQANQVDGI